MTGRTSNCYEPEPRGVRRLPRGATTSGKATLFSEERHACEVSSSLAWVERATSSRYHRGIPTYSQLSQISPGASASVFGKNQNINSPGFPGVFASRQRVSARQRASKQL